MSQTEPSLIAFETASPPQIAPALVADHELLSQREGRSETLLSPTCRSALEDK